MAGEKLKLKTKQNENKEEVDSDYLVVLPALPHRDIGIYLSLNLSLHTNFNYGLIKMIHRGI